VRHKGPYIAASDLRGRLMPTYPRGTFTSSQVRTFGDKFWEVFMKALDNPNYDDLSWLCPTMIFCAHEELIPFSKVFGVIDQLTKRKIADTVLNEVFQAIDNGFPWVVSLASTRRGIDAEDRLKDMPDTYLPPNLKQLWAIAAFNVIPVARFAMDDLNRQGYHVADNFLPLELFEAIADDTSLFKYDPETKLKAPKVPLKEGTNTPSYVREDRIAPVQESDQDAPRLAAFVQLLADPNGMFCDNLTKSFKKQTRKNPEFWHNPVKLTINEAPEYSLMAGRLGAKTGKHQLTEVPEGKARQVVCVYFLNEHWVDKEAYLPTKPVEGGDFVLHYKNGPVNIKPVFNRLLMFWADAVHETLPCTKQNAYISFIYDEEKEIAS